MRMNQEFDIITFIAQNEQDLTASETNAALVGLDFLSSCQAGPSTLFAIHCRAESSAGIAMRPKSKSRTRKHVPEISLD